MEIDTKVTPSTAALADHPERQHYKGKFGYVSAPSPEGDTHVMIFWERMGVSSVWAIKDLEVVSK